MDPNETLKELIDAACAGEKTRFEEKAAYLALWLRRGGFPPENPMPAAAAGNGVAVIMVETPEWSSETLDEIFDVLCTNGLTSTDDHGVAVLA